MITWTFYDEQGRVLGGTSSDGCIVEGGVVIDGVKYIPGKDLRMPSHDGGSAAMVHVPYVTARDDRGSFQWTANAVP